MKSVGSAHPGYSSPGSVAGAFDSYFKVREATGLGAIIDRLAAYQDREEEKALRAEDRAIRAEDRAFKLEDRARVAKERQAEDAYYGEL